MKLAILSDIHEDFISLEKAIRKIDRLRCDKLICLGDINGYDPNYHKRQYQNSATACLALLKANADIILAGNHDLHISQRIPSKTPIFNYPNNWFELSIEQKRELSGDLIWLYDDEKPADYTKEDLDYIQTLPESYLMEEDDLKLMFTHYIYPNSSGSLKAMYSKAEHFETHFEVMREQKVQFSFCGHDHRNNAMVIHPHDRYPVRYKKKLQPGALIITPSISSAYHKGRFITFDTSNKELKTFKV